MSDTPPHPIDRILDAAREIVTERGVHSVTYRAIAEKLEMSAGTVAYYFPSRDDLLEAVLDRHHEQLAALTEPLLLLEPEVIRKNLGGIRLLVRFAFAHRADVRLRLATWMARWSMTDRRRDVLAHLLHKSAEALGGGRWSEAERRVVLQSLVFATQRFAASSAADLMAVTSAESEEAAREIVEETISRMFERLFE